MIGNNQDVNANDNTYFKSSSSHINISQSVNKGGEQLSIGRPVST